MNTLLPAPSDRVSSPRPDQGGFTPWVCGVLSLLPGAGVVLGPVALKLGCRDLQLARAHPAAVSRGGAWLAIVLGALGLLVQVAALTALLSFGPDRLLSAAGVADPANAPTNEPPPQPAGKKVRMGDNVHLEIQGEKRRVLVDATVCMREGQLEQFLTRKMTKEHEAVLAADVDARNIHAALILAGAKEGSPVKFAPKYEPATGSVVKVTLQYEQKGKLVTVPAQQWVRNIRTRKDLDIDWVFAGSRLVDVPLEANKKYYLANDGDVICVSNFETAMLDLPVNSPKDNADLAFEIHTERVPPKDTKVTVILEVVPEKK